MPTITANYAASGTLTAGTVTVVQLSQHHEQVEVVNRSQTGEIWVRFDGVNPTVAGAECYVVLGARRFTLVDRIDTDVAEVRLISNAALNFAVEGAR